MIEEISAILVLLQIILQLGAAYFAYRLMRLTGTFRAWSLIVIALIIQAIRRILSQLIIMNLVPLGSIIELVDRLFIALLVSACMIVGMYELEKIFSKKLGK